MIASLNGTILNKKPDSIIIDVGGVGYHVSVPLRNLGDIPDKGEEIFVHTYTHVREDALQLFGFLTEEERRVFSTLLGITGVGPKLALAILSGMPVERFTEAVYNEDISLLATIPGLGKKTASRLVLELKGKLPSFGGVHETHKGTVADDAVSALENLGYKKSMSENAVASAMNNGAKTIEDIIKDALKSLTESK
jgi:Holliday junction DNA helicase RuvA